MTFLVSGIWHGANWTFIVWGCMHGVLQIVEKALGWQKYEGNKKVIRCIRMIITFLLVNFAWVFFRMPNVGDAFGIIGVMFTKFGVPEVIMGKEMLLMLFFSLLILFIKDLKDEFLGDKLAFLDNKIVRWTIYVILFCMIINFGVLDGGQFIYVNF